MTEQLKISLSHVTCPFYLAVICEHNSPSPLAAQSWILFCSFLYIEMNQNTERNDQTAAACLGAFGMHNNPNCHELLARVFVHLLSITSYSVCSRQKLDRSPSSRCRHTHTKNNLIAVKRCTTCMCYSKPHVQLESRKNPFKKYLKLASRFKRLRYLCEVGV